MISKVNERSAEPKMITMQDAVQRLNDIGISISYQCLRRSVLNGEIPAVQIGRRYFINWSLLQQQIDPTGGTA